MIMLDRDGSLVRKDFDAPASASAKSRMQGLSRLAGHLYAVVKRLRWGVDRTDGFAGVDSERQSATYMTRQYLMEEFS